MKRVRSKMVQYWHEPFLEMKRHSIEWMPARKLTFTAIVSSIAALLQSAGGFVPGVGFLVSAMTTLPIFLAAFVSARQGFLSYCVTILLLWLIQPGELFIFPFTTGALGLVLGVSFYKLKTRCTIVLSSGAALFAGIMTPLFLLRFPVLGPGFRISFLPLLLAAVFSFLYAWLAAAACSASLKRLAHALPDRVKRSSDQQEK